ncbi:PrpF domain-containing protein [Paenibacillus thiaminolyticus]|uniref:PrpF domain-containing protein n=1 Tax=Paenibacillus thiaminolyticus TaxID=49283 RepID=UPI0023F87534|nr:PrpF domain-containing protein [Paenibacillus thiaminolyticus]
MALAAACQIPGTIPNRLTASSGSAVRIGHPSGTMYAEAAVARTASDWLVMRAACGRTARRLMAGDAYTPAAVLSAPN